MNTRARVLALGLAALPLASCEATQNYLSHNSAPVQTGPGSLFQAPDANRNSDKIAKLPAEAADVDCPEVDVSDGGASARVGGDSSQSVRYQFDITDTARECNPQGNQFALKVGVAGKLLIGPAGSPGAYSTTLHVRVTSDADNKTLFDKAFSVSANTNGADQAPFRVVTDPILLPLTRARLNDDYSITVGLGASAGVTTHHHKKRRS